MIYPSLEEVKSLKDQYALIPVAYEAYADLITPIQMFLNLKQEGESCFLLESMTNSTQRGRYSFMGISPQRTVQLTGNQVRVKTPEGEEVFQMERPLEYIQQLLSRYSSPKLAGFPDLTGGLVGYLAYDSVRYIEKSLKAIPIDDIGTPECYWMICKEIITFDHVEQKIIIIHNLEADQDLEVQYAEAVSRSQTLMQQLTQSVSSLSTPAAQAVKASISANQTRAAFMEKVKRAKEAIEDGEIFQVVLSRRLTVESPPDPFETYRKLRLQNPSPYMYYLQLDDHVIVGSSPEMLAKVKDQTIYTRPIAGTIKRGKDSQEDKRLEQLLLQDEKERAEHMMLVDLGRNDIGKVASPGSVEVTRLMEIEKYSQVMHLVSNVKGQLAPGQTALDGLMSILPAGTLSGAPKVRAMQWIDTLEPTKRGLYGGTVGYLGFNGELDTCIAIRTLLYKGNKAYIQAGAGIVYDSIPEKEFEEVENKMKAMLYAIQAEGDTK